MQFRHAKEKRSKSDLGFEGYQTGLSIGVFWILVTIIPIYNKVVFNGVAGDEGFSFPLTTTFFQLSVAFVILSMMVLFQCALSNHFYVADNFKVKVEKIWIPGCLFGLKVGLTNWGLKLLPIAPHLLLQSTDIMWTIVFAHLIIHERLNLMETFACIGTVLGSILVAYRTHQEINSLFGVFINLLAPILLGLVVIQMKKATTELLNVKIHQRKPIMGVVEFTMFKLFFSSLSVIPFIYVFEYQVFEALETINPMLIVVACGGGVIAVLYQINFTWLTSLISAMSVGVVTGVKILPQWIGSLLFTGTLDTSPTHLLGLILLVGSALLWTKIKHQNMMTGVEIITHRSRQYSQLSC